MKRKNNLFMNMTSCKTSLLEASDGFLLINSLRQKWKISKRQRVGNNISNDGSIKNHHKKTINSSNDAKAAYQKYCITQ